MIDEKYVSELEIENDALRERLAKAETIILKATRKKGTYPVFKLIKRKITKTKWIIDCEYLTNCDSKENIIKSLKFTINNPVICKEDDGELIGFQYWRQSINYRWALAGLSRYLDMKLQPWYNIEIDPKTGDIFYKKY